jgi:hypothetical protein
MDFRLVLAIIALVFGVPVGSLLASFLMDSRGRWLELLGALVVAVVTAAAVYYYGTSMSVDGLSYALGAWLAITAGAIIGSLVVRFLLSLRDRRPTGAHIEF